MSVAPGWYPDPADPSTQRYWDGEGWIGAPLPVDATPPPGPPADTEPTPAPTATPGAPGVEVPAGGPATPGTAAVPPVTPPQAPAAPPGWPYPPHGHPPYARPVAPPLPRGLVLAPLGARLVARLIDIAVLLGLSILVNGWFVWQYIQEIWPLFAEVWRRSLAGDTSTEGLPQPDPRIDNLLLVILLLTAALWFAYEVPSLANNGQTFGKRVMRIKVVPVAGEQQLGFGRAIRRWNTLGLPVFLWYCCGIGFVLQLIACAMPLFDLPLRQALHDKQAQTVVVQVPQVEPTRTQTPADEGTKTPGGADDHPQP